jgi:hypothetical protein
VPQPRAHTVWLTQRAFLQRTVQHHAHQHSPASHAHASAQRPRVAVAPSLFPGADGEGRDLWPAARLPALRRLRPPVMDARRHHVALRREDALPLHRRLQLRRRPTPRHLLVRALAQPDVGAAAQPQVLRGRRRQVRCRVLPARQHPHRQVPHQGAPSPTWHHLASLGTSPSPPARAHPLRALLPSGRRERRSHRKGRGHQVHGRAGAAMQQRARRSHADLRRGAWRPGRFPHRLPHPFARRPRRP